MSYNWLGGQRGVSRGARESPGIWGVLGLGG